MARCDRSLHWVRAERLANPFGTLERGETAADENAVPTGAILIEQQDWLSRGPDPRPQARRLDLHQTDQAVDFRLIRNELGQDAAETERLLAKRRAHPVLTGRRRVAPVEHQIDDLQH